MSNINRDYTIELLLELPEYNKKFEILPGKTLQFYKHDRNQTIYIIVKGNWNKEFTLKMGILCPSTKQVLEYYPVFKGEQEGETVFKVALSNEILANPSKYEFQFFILNNGTVLSSNISAFKVRDCL